MYWGSDFTADNPVRRATSANEILHFLRETEAIFVRIHRPEDAAIWFTGIFGHPKTLINPVRTVVLILDGLIMARTRPSCALGLEALGLFHRDDCGGPSSHRPLCKAC